MKPLVLKSFLPPLALVLLLSPVALAQVASGQTSSASQQPEADENTRVRELFRLGTEAIRQGDLHKARTALSEAWELRRTYDVAAALAQAEYELGHLTVAAELLEYCLKNFAPVESEKTLGQIQAAYDTVRQKVAGVDVVVDRPNAEVRLDGQLLGNAPLRVRRFLRAGTHRVSARDGEELVEDELSVVPGRDYQVKLAFGATRFERTQAPVVATDQPTKASEPPPKANKNQPEWWPVLVGGGVFLVGATTGLVLHLSADASFDDADTISDRVGPAGCSNGTADPADCRKLRDEAENGDAYRNWSRVSFGVAAASLVATVGYLFWPRGQGDAAASSGSAPKTGRNQGGFRWQPGASVDDRGAVLSVSGSF